MPTMPSSASEGASARPVAGTALRKCDSIVTVCPRLQLERALERTDISVTTLLEQLVGEPVDAHELRHVMTQAVGPNALHVEAGHPLLQRSAVLRGRSSAQPYVYAESLLVADRLPADVLGQLETGSDPIGRVLAKEGIAFTRFSLPWSDPSHPFLVGDRHVPEEHLLARTYRADVDGTPVMEIWEWFLPGLESFLTTDP